MNFAEHPPSLGEVRAKRSGSSADWTPREALLDVLRLIDSGEADIDALVVCWRARHADGGPTGHFRQATPDAFVTLGLLECTKFKMQD